MNSSRDQGFFSGNSLQQTANLLAANVMFAQHPNGANMPPTPSYPPLNNANLRNSSHDSISHGEIDPNQAALLQAMARRTHSSAAKATVTGAGASVSSHSHKSTEDRDSTAQLALVLQENLMRFLGRDAETPTATAIDEDDPAALLEALAAYEHPMRGNGHGDENQDGEGEGEAGNDHFAELLQAAATAGGVEDEQRGGRRAKRRRVDADEDAAQLAREREIWGPEEDDDGRADDDEAVLMYVPGGEPVGASDARAAGVHSAVALFRRPSTASKKYTRKPMSKLFTSLELTPEQFLHLQAAAKTYMLHPEHPERRDCVGNRDRADTDMVKLKLFGCVKAFLEDEGWGEGLWGAQSDAVHLRKLQWPAMKNKIISLVTPLLRRMVTNERQRQYAVETRSKVPTSTTRRSKRTTEGTTLSPPFLSVDPSLSTSPYALHTTFPSTPPHPSASAHSPTHQPTFPLIPSNPPTTFHVSITTTTRTTRIRPKLLLTPTTCPNFPSLVQHVNNLLHDFEDGCERAPLLGRISVLTPAGLADVGAQDEWLRAVDEVCGVEWLDNEVRVVVEAGRVGG